MLLSACVFKNSEPTRWVSRAANKQVRNHTTVVVTSLSCMKISTALIKWYEQLNILAQCTGVTSFTGTNEGVCLSFETGGVDDQESVHIQGVKIKRCKPAWTFFSTKYFQLYHLLTMMNSLLLVSGWWALFIVVCTSNRFHVLMCLWSYMF